MIPEYHYEPSAVGGGEAIPSLFLFLVFSKSLSISLCEGETFSLPFEKGEIGGFSYGCFVTPLLAMTETLSSCIKYASPLIISSPEMVVSH